MLTKWYVKGKSYLENGFGKYVNNEEGAQALEWVALGVVVMAIMMGVATVVEGQASQIGSAIVSKISNMISSIGG